MENDWRTQFLPARLELILFGWMVQCLQVLHRTLIYVICSNGCRETSIEEMLLFAAPDHILSSVVWLGANLHSSFKGFFLFFLNFLGIALSKVFIIQSLVSR